MNTCKDCEDRHYNCHQKCERYQSSRKEPFKADVTAGYWGERNKKIEHKKYVKRRK